MKIYITRHGQVDSKAEYFNGDVSLPKGEVPLSELGRQQATLLGKKLKKLGFQGTIFASPLLRTMETAELIATETGSTIIPTPWFHEIFGNQSYIEAYKGYSSEELRSFFPHVAADAFMEEVWWATRAETWEMVCERVSKGLSEYLEKEKEDVLFVGHAASAAAALDYLHLRECGILWNCGLSLYDTEYTECNYCNDREHLPDYMVTCNKIKGADIDFDATYSDLYPIEIPEKLREERTTKLLHIGDTHSETYLYYKQMIQMVKPDIVVHTGDTADEVKVGRMPETREEYLTKIQEFLDILKGAGCRVYWICGNNDLPEEIVKRAPFIEVVEPDTVLQLEGIDICVTHSREQITNKKADVYLYGHGTRAAGSELEKRIPGSDALYLNVMWNTYVLTLPQKELYEFERPEYRKGIWERDKFYKIFEDKRNEEI